MRFKTVSLLTPLLAVFAVGLAVVVPSEGLAGNVSVGIVVGDPGPFFKFKAGTHRSGSHRNRSTNRAVREGFAVPRKHRRHRHGHRNRFRPVFVFPHYGAYSNDYHDRREAYVPPPAPPPPGLPPQPPKTEVPVEPAAAPDPRGPHRLPARGATSTTAPYAVGEALPADLPHVTLDWRHYDLPEPPVGRIYARVGRDVLLITADDRVVEKVVEL